MEIRLQLRLQTLLEFMNYLERLELESVALICVFILMIPFFIFTFWSLGLTILWELFWLGLRAGIILSFVCATYLALVRCTNWTKILPIFGRNKEESKNSYGKCTLLDVLLSVYFQSGLWIPSVIWNPLMDCVTWTPATQRKKAELSGPARAIALRTKQPDMIEDIDGGAEDFVFSRPSMKNVKEELMDIAYDYPISTEEGDLIEELITTNFKLRSGKTVSRPRRRTSARKKY